MVKLDPDECEGPQQRDQAPSVDRTPRVIAKVQHVALIHAESYPPRAFRHRLKEERLLPPGPHRVAALLDVATHPAALPVRHEEHRAPVARPNAGLIEPPPENRQGIALQMLRDAGVVARMAPFDEARRSRQQRRAPGAEGSPARMVDEHVECLDGAIAETPCPQAKVRLLPIPGSEHRDVERAGRRPRVVSQVKAKADPDGNVERLAGELGGNLGVEGLERLDGARRAARHDTEAREGRIVGPRRHGAGVGVRVGRVLQPFDPVAVHSGVAVEEEEIVARRGSGGRVDGGGKAEVRRMADEFCRPGRAPRLDGF